MGKLDYIATLRAVIKCVICVTMCGGLKERKKKQWKIVMSGFLPVVRADISALRKQKYI